MSQWLGGRSVETPAPARCSSPGCDRPAIDGDGPSTPCYACLYRFGAAAAHPEDLSDGEVMLLLVAHGDVIELVSGERGQRWRWMGE